MEIQFETSDNSIIIYLKGELDHHSSISAKERIELKLSAALQKNIVYNLNELTFMDSSGIGLIANGYKIADSFGGKVTVITNNEKFHKIFVMSRMDELVTLAATTQSDVLSQENKDPTGSPSATSGLKDKDPIGSGLKDKGPIGPGGDFLWK